MARTGKKQKTSSTEDEDTNKRKIAKCLKAGTVEELTKLVNEIGTEFLQQPNVMSIRDIEVPAIAYLCSKGNHECVRKALELDPMQANLKDAVRESIEAFSFECIKLVLDAHQKRGNTPLDVASMQLTGGLRMIHFAAQVGIDILKEVCEHEGVGLGSFIFDGKTVVKDQFISQTPVDAARSGDCVDYLCGKWKQDPNNGIKETECDIPRPLHRAVLRDRADVIERLLANGAHVHARTVNGTPVVGKPIHVLCNNTKMPSKELLKSLRALLAHGADPAEPSLMQQKTPLTIALAAKNQLCVEFLVVEAKVPVEQEVTKFQADAAARKMLETAIAKRDSGAKISEPQEDAEVRTAEGETVTLFEWDEGIRCDNCRLNSASRELTSQDEFTSSANCGDLPLKAVKAGRCLLGETLESDGSYPWLAFWSLPDSSRRPSRSTNALSRMKSTLVFALGMSDNVQKQLEVVDGSSDVVLSRHLGWDVTLNSVAGNAIDLDTLTDTEAMKLDRSDRLVLLRKALGGKQKVICAKVKDAVSFPVVIATVDEATGAIFGCLATRVDS